VIGLIAKVLLFFAILITAALVILDLTGVAEHGTISLSQPSVEPCRRAVAALQPPQHPVLVQVRWIWEPKGYGWGCFWENEDATRHTIVPMPR
jgi:hypothetical protein